MALRSVAWSLVPGDVVYKVCLYDECTVGAQSIQLHHQDRAFLPWQGLQEKMMLGNELKITFNLNVGIVLFYDGSFPQK